MSQEAFLKNSEFIQKVLFAPASDAMQYPIEIAYPLVKFAVGSWIKTAAVDTASYFTPSTETPEEDEPMIEPLSEERDDESVTPQIEQDFKHLPGMELVDEEGEIVKPATDSEEIEEEIADPTAVELDAEDHLTAAVEVNREEWTPLIQATDEYFTFINRLVMFAPEMHKEAWQQLVDEIEAIFSKATLTPIGLAARFNAVEQLYRSTVASA